MAVLQLLTAVALPLSVAAVRAARPRSGRRPAKFSARLRCSGGAGDAEFLRLVSERCLRPAAASLD
jgi:hypothetical protein